VNRILALGGVSRGVRIAATLALLFHPLYLWLSCTYMTDVPFVDFSAIALFFYVSAVRRVIGNARQSINQTNSPETNTGSPTLALV